MDCLACRAVLTQEGQLPCLVLCANVLGSCKVSTAGSHPTPAFSPHLRRPISIAARTARNSIHRTSSSVSMDVVSSGERISRRVVESSLIFSGHSIESVRAWETFHVNWLLQSDIALARERARMAGLRRSAFPFALVGAFATALAGCGGPPQSSVEHIANASKPATAAHSAHAAEPNNSSASANATGQETAKSAQPGLTAHASLLNDENSVLFIGRDGQQVRIPVVPIVNAQYGITPTQPLLPYPPGGFRPVHFTIPSDQTADLCVYFLNDGMNDGGVELLGPRGWWVTRAGVGADGSVAIDLESEDGTGALTFFIDTAMGSIDEDVMAYFPNWQQLLPQDAQSFGPVTSPTFAARVLLNSNELAYELADGTHGLAIFVHGSNVNWAFIHEEIRGIPHALETTILNYELSVVSAS